jgi:hypothetical protein
MADLLSYMRPDAILMVGGIVSVITCGMGSVDRLGVGRTYSSAGTSPVPVTIHRMALFLQPYEPHK